jgi:hypothetical protein
VDVSEIDTFENHKRESYLYYAYICMHWRCTEMVTEGAMIIIQNKEIRDVLAKKDTKIDLLNSVIEEALNDIMLQIFGAKQLCGEGESAFTWMPPTEYIPRAGTDALVKLAM